MSDLLKETLASYVARPQGLAHRIEIPVDQMEWLAATIHRLRETAEGKDAATLKTREQFIKLEAQVKSQNKMIATQQRKLVESLREGSAYEGKLRTAEEEFEKLQKQLDQSRAEVTTLKDKLKAQSLPDVKDAEPKTDIEVELQEAKIKLEAAEKKVKASSGELDYIRGAYQTASNSATELARENKDLNTRIAELEHLASESLRTIHDTNKDNIIRDQTRQLRDAQTIIAHREEDLARAQKELRTVKNGRRETRQTSVPRSPRVPMMSPRPRGGANSRGNSPAPAALVLDGSSTSVTPAPGRHQTPVANPQITRLRD
jgi:chromosome segregation ATPase